MVLAYSNVIVDKRISGILRAEPSLAMLGQTQNLLPRELRAIALSDGMCERKQVVFKGLPWSEFGLC